YELLTGHPPQCPEGTSLEKLFRKRTEDLLPPHPSKINSQLEKNGDLEWICLQCLHRDREQRFSSANELADALHRYQMGEKVQPNESLGQWFKRITGPFRGKARDPNYVDCWKWAPFIEGITCSLAHLGLFCFFQ